MFESFVIVLREGIEAALVIGIILVMLKRSGRRDLERPVYWGVALAVLGSLGAALALNTLPLSEEVYEGALYWVSATFVISMMVWMHRKARTLRSEIEQRVQQTMTRDRREAWALGAFAFLMVFREGAETVMFLSAVRLTTAALLSFIGTLLGLILAIVFVVMFVRGSLHVNLRRFFSVTEWVLGIFVAQLVINGYHEFSEAGWLPATQHSMALIGPVVRNNSLFVLAVVAIPLFIWLSGLKRGTPQGREDLSPAERRLALARARRERFYGYGAIATTLIILAAVGVVYAREVTPKKLPLPEMLRAAGDSVNVPLATLADGKLHRYGFACAGRTVRFLALKTADGNVHTALDACEICGTFGYLQEGNNLVCLNCAAEINPLTVGEGGGCNPIPLESKVVANDLRIPVAALEKEAHRFEATDTTALTAVDPVCGMQVKISEAATFVTRNGKTYYFCSAHCRALFEKTVK